MAFPIQYFYASTILTREMLTLMMAPIWLW